MEDQDMYQDIPERFFSFETKKPFERCIECNTYLLDGKDYIIEKAIRKYDGFSAEDTIFDYAICVSCAMEMRKEFSQESMTNIDAYFSSGLNLAQLSHSDHGELNVDQCLDRCIIKHSSIQELEEFQIYAYCRGNKLFKGVPPYMVSSAAIDELLPLLSSPTTDFLNGFYDRHFSPDPSLMEPTPKLVFI